MAYTFTLSFLQLEQKQKDIARMHAEVDQYGDRIRAMSDHLKNVRQERQQTQVINFYIDLH